MGRRVVLALVALMIVAPRTAMAEAEPHTLRAFYVGAAGGVAMSEELDDLLMRDALTPRAAVGINAGINLVAGPGAFGIDAYALPLGNTYVARGSFVFGHRWDRGYVEPCKAPIGMQCTATYPDRPVRSIAGLKLGATLGDTPDGAVSTVEVGLALRSQFLFELAFLYDPVAGAPGGSMDFGMQFRSFYFGMQIMGVADRASTLPLSAVMNLGYAWYPW